jgi:hypothetical protein
VAQDVGPEFKPQYHKKKEKKKKSWAWQLTTVIPAFGRIMHLRPT